MSVKVPISTTPRPALTTSPRPLSSFTIKNLLDLNNHLLAYKLPLSVIALVDLNAFYAQVECVRLGLSDEDPVVCQQWQSIIAVSYAARKYGISRLDTVHSAKLKCPHLICAHAGVYKKGDSHWAYYPGSPSPVDHKVSLDTYRRESRKILRIVQSKFDLVDKASVDESYVDLGRAVFKLLLQKFPQLQEAMDKIGDGGDPLSLLLPNIPNKLPEDLQWEGYIAESDKEMSDDGQTVDMPPVIEDWDDVTLLLGSQLLLDLRRTIYEELGYTTSAGLARNRLVAKLSGDFKKPDNQTIVRNCALNRFLQNFELTDITGFGAQLGKSLIVKFQCPSNTNSIAFIRDNYTQSMMREELRDDPELANKLYLIVRGLYPLELTSKVDVKSMMSTKNFRDNSPWCLKDAYEWLTVYAGDLSNRLLDLDNESMDLSLTKISKRDRGVLKRPRTITIGVRSTAFVRQTRQMPIPIHKDISKMKQTILECGCQLLREYMEHNTDLTRLNNGKTPKELFAGDPKNVKIMKMQNMSLAISNFVSLNENSSIESFARKKNDGDKDKTNNGNESINHELIEINKEIKRKNEEKLTQPPKKPKVLSIENKQHINNLFMEFNKSNNDQSQSQGQGQSQNQSQSHIKNKPSTQLSTKPNNKLKNLSQSQLRHLQQQLQQLQKGKLGLAPNSGGSNDIIKSLQNHQPVNLLAELQLSQYCPKCKVGISDPIEHNDFHIAIELSEKWNQ
ncbi:conserved hypothetical protein [Lodderomyces elongisporus NRRL YB-4239]|uniref:DNA polymerase eta n=1 Tax=Lodderomyces elongisporus (strain ATCC 11503 / CBS 2605 / JCM 1781 / NBRC 1676 / NRRL YB-4239) TaxID=379508 RepID=A5DV91_LODEL|nr:conserved hypothetical protein [Lodderomyces elongisporus NRRL YB-4239]